MNGQPRTCVFVLNLDRSPDRMAWMASQLAALGIPFQRVAAIDAERDDLDAAMRSLGVRIGKPAWRPLGRGEIGCYLTHLTAFRLAMKNGCAAALMLEDDAKLSGDIMPVLNDFARLERKPVVLKLEPWKRAHWRVSFAKFANIEAIYTPDLTWNSAAYCISRAAMKQALARLTEMRLPLDNDLFSQARSGLTVLVSSPPLAAQDWDRFESLIHEGRRAIEAAPRTVPNAPRSKLREGLSKLKSRYKDLIALVRPFWVTARQAGVSRAFKLRLWRKSKVT